MSLSKMLQEYREGLRGMPTYEELAAIALHDQCADPIVERNVSLLRQRSTVGVQKYGTTLADNKLPLRAWLNHALEESLDQANYLQAAMAEIDSAAAPQVVADERKAFEAHITDNGAWPRAAERSVDGGYRLMATAVAWNTWRAATDSFVSRSATPVQEQVAGKPCPYCGSMDGSHDKAYPHPRAPVQPVAVPDDLDMQTIRERDYNAEMADKLAEAISKHFGIDIGEHSNMNCPWHEALEAIENAMPVMWAALNMNGKTVCANQDKSACDVERLCIKTPTTIAPLYAGASEPQ